MSADGADEGPEAIPYRLTLLKMIGAVMIRRGISIGDVADVIGLPERTFSNLFSGHIGGFSSSRLIAIRLTIELIPLDEHGNPPRPEPRSCPRP